MDVIEKSEAVRGSGIAALRESCRDWAVGEGPKYMESSEWNMNRSSGNTLSCTAHDIGVYEYFRDWMSSRAAQAGALAEDIRTFQALNMEGRMTRESMATFGRSFGERAVMALYGVDDKVQGDKFRGWTTAVGEKLYPETANDILGRVQSGDFEHLKALAARLDAFKDGWEAVNAAEWAAYDYTRRNHVGPVASVHTAYGWTEGDSNLIFSTDMLNRYMAEVNTRLCARNAIDKREPDSPDITIRHAPEGNPVRIEQFEDNRDVLYKIISFSSGKSPHGVCPFDGQALVQEAKVHVELEREAEAAKQREAAQAGSGDVKPRSRETRDLDAACAGLSGVDGADLSAEL